MQPCRFCFRIIPVAKPYDPTEDWICSECAKEFGGHARRINEEDHKKRYKAALTRIADKIPAAFSGKWDRKRWISEVMNLHMQDMRERRHE